MNLDTAVRGAENHMHSNNLHDKIQTVCIIFCYNDNLFHTALLTIPVVRALADKSPFQMKLIKK